MLKPNPNIRKLLIKFVKNRCTTKEIDIIIAYLKKTEGTSEFPDFDEVLHLFDVIPDIEHQRAQEIYKNILNSAEVDRPRPKERYKRILRYIAAAILVGVLATSYFFIQNTNNDNTTPSVVNIENIEPGTDKAILTLGDGSLIELDKFHTYQNKNIISNGNQIVYENKEKEIVASEIEYNYLTIPRGGEYHLILSDGTQVWLNSESQLKYPVNFIKGEVREVELVYGEAYFDVSPSTEHNGSKFRVLNKFQEVQVLGTEFNIKAYNDESSIYTTLVEGSVVVDNQYGNKNLIPNQQSILNLETKEIKVTTVDVDSETSWRNGVFSFIDMPLKDITKVLSRWYDVDFVFVNRKVEVVKFNGNLSKDRSIERILSLVLSNKLNSYEIKGKTIILK